MYTLSVQQNPQNSPPTMSKTLSFSSILSGGIKGYCKLQIQGARLNKTKVERESIMYANDQRLSWVVCPPAPRLQVCPQYHITTVMSPVPHYYNHIPSTTLLQSYPQYHITTIMSPVPHYYNHIPSTTLLQ